MAGLPRKAQKIWGGSLPPNGNIGQPGSLASGVEVYSGDLAVIQAGAWLNGWLSAIVGTDSPVLEEFNGILLVLTQQLAYIFARGIPEWDIETAYNTGDFAKGIGNGILYVSKQDGNTNHAVTDTNWWKVFGSDLFDALGAAAAAQAAAIAAAEAFATAADAVVQSDAASDATAKVAAAVAALQPQVCKGWVTFNGVTMEVYNSFNVAEVTRIGTGRYDIQWASPPGNQNYPWHGNCGAPDGTSPGGGDNNIIVGLGVVNSTDLTIGCWEANIGGSGRFEDADFITVSVFGPNTL